MICICYHILYYKHALIICLSLFWPYCDMILSNFSTNMECLRSKEMILLVELYILPLSRRDWRPFQLRFFLKNGVTLYRLHLLLAEIWSQHKPWSSVGLLLQVTLFTWLEVHILLINEALKVKHKKSNWMFFFQIIKGKRKKSAVCRCLPQCLFWC